MALQAITLSVDPAFAGDTGQSALSDAGCAFCGAPAGRWAGPGYLPCGGSVRTVAAACPLCALPQHLERPRIDEEAALVWLPEISQAALNATMREIHIAIQAVGEDVHADAVFRKRSAGLGTLYYARAVLAQRSAPAVARVGTASPRELGLALLELSSVAYASRAQLLGGLRLMPLGRFFQGEHDVYPEIVRFWRDSAATAATRLSGAL
jgi:intracellular multiplication protein IcmJ